MSKDPAALIDTVDSSAHYRVKGKPEDVALHIAAMKRQGTEFAEFELCQRGNPAIWIAPDKVIAVLEPA